MNRTWDYEIQLANLEKTINDRGYEVEELVPTNAILANRLNVHSAEFWAAKLNTVKLEHVFEIHEIEYGGERAVIYNDEEYNIERTYLNKDGFLELTLSKWGDEHD